MENSIIAESASLQDFRSLVKIASYFLRTVTVRTDCEDGAGVAIRK